MELGEFNGAVIEKTMTDLSGANTGYFEFLQLRVNTAMLGCAFGT